MEVKLAYEGMSRRDGGVAPSRGTTGQAFAVPRRGDVLKIHVRIYWSKGHLEGNGSEGLT